MTPEELFLHRIDRISTLLLSANEADVLDLAGYLRQLLFDKKSLVDTVNKRKIKLEFEVGIHDPHPDIGAKPAWSLSIDTIDPYDTHENRWTNNTAILTANQFGQHVVAELKGRKYRVIDLVKLAANVEGGIHKDESPNHPLSQMSNFNRFAVIDNLPFFTRQVRLIARVTLRSLSPLVKDVKSRLSERTPASDTSSTKE